MAEVLAAFDLAFDLEKVDFDDCGSDNRMTARNYFGIRNTMLSGCTRDVETTPLGDHGLVVALELVTIATMCGNEADGRTVDMNRYNQRKLTPI